ncbi:MAG TPA: hypothetical protein VHV56_02285 [Pseudolabrys sp.]|jgi:hypothetical protein|nr:hypothetical protein [Pseudolabrys sp.]
MTNVVSFRHRGDPARRIDFDLLVDLMALHHGMSRREATLWSWRECRRDKLTVVRSPGFGEHGQNRPSESRATCQNRRLK